MRGMAELLPSDVVCSKDTLHLIIECCVGGFLFALTPVAGSRKLRWERRVHPFGVIRGERDLREGVKEDDCT